MILIEFALGKYFSLDQVARLESFVTGGLVRTLVVLESQEHINLDIDLKDFLDDISKIYKTNKIFTIYSVSRNSSPVEKSPKPRD